MELTIFLISFIFLLALGVPIAIALIFPSFLYLYMIGLAPGAIATRLFDPMTSPTFLAIPFYILAAQILNDTGITDKIFDLAEKVIGFLPGGLGYTNVIASMIFAGMSGAAIADAGGLGKVEIKAMQNAGYDSSYSAGITAASSVIGPIIPPSIPLVMYGIIAEQSVTRLFMGGLLPGVVIGVCLMVVISVLSIKFPDKLPRQEKGSLKEIISSFKNAFFPLLLPIIIIGGIMTGRFTPTEAGAIAVLYAIILSIFTKKFSLSSLYVSFRDAMKSAAMILFIVAGALCFSWVITISRLPQNALSYIFEATTNKTIILLGIAILILVMGMFMSATASLMILAPMLVRVAPILELDLIHLGVFLVLGVMIGVVTPPVGPVLYVISDIANIKVGKVCIGLIPFLIALIISWLIIIFVPQTVLFLPGLF